MAGVAGERHAHDNLGDRASEKIYESYVGRVLRLTLLAPDIVDAILGGRSVVAKPTSFSEAINAWADPARYGIVNTIN